MTFRRCFAWPFVVTETYFFTAHLAVMEGRIAIELDQISSRWKTDLCLLNWYWPDRRDFDDKRLSGRTQPPMQWSAQTHRKWWYSCYLPLINVLRLGSIFSSTRTVKLLDQGFPDENRWHEHERSVWMITLCSIRGAIAITGEWFGCAMSRWILIGGRILSLSEHLILLTNRSLNNGCNGDVNPRGKHLSENHTVVSIPSFERTTPCFQNDML